MKSSISFLSKLPLPQRPLTFTSFTSPRNPCFNFITTKTHFSKPSFIHTVLGNHHLNINNPTSIVPNKLKVVCCTIMSTTQGSGSGVTRFSLSPSSSAALVLQKGDITKWFIDGSSDAIVNPANEKMLGGGGADGAIHRAAGPELREACYKVPEVRPGIRCPTGEARITSGFRLPASHVIHTVGPIYDSGSDRQAFLANAYRNSLYVAKQNSLQYIAFPAISCGVYGYPFDEAATVAISTIKEFSDGLKEVHFVLFSDEIYNVWSSKAKELLQN